MKASKLPNNIEIFYIDNGDHKLYAIDTPTFITLNQWSKDNNTTEAFRHGGTGQYVNEKGIAMLKQDGFHVISQEVSIPIPIDLYDQVGSVTRLRIMTACIDTEDPTNFNTEMMMFDLPLKVLNQIKAKAVSHQEWQIRQALNNIV